MALPLCTEVITTVNCKWTDDPIKRNKTNDKFVPTDFLKIAD